MTEETTPTPPESATTTGDKAVGEKYDAGVDRMVSHAKRSDSAPDGLDEETQKRARGVIAPYVSPGVRLGAAWSWRLIAIAAGIGVAFWLLSQVTIVVMPVLIALLLAALLSPFAAFLQRHRWPRALAAITTVLGFIIVVVSLLTVVGQQIYSGTASLWGQVRTGFLSISTWLQSNPFGIDSSLISKWIEVGTTKLTTYAQQESGQIASGALGAASSITDFGAGLLITLFATFFFVYDGHTIFRWFLHLLPLPARERAKGAALRGWQSLSQYVRVQVLVAGVDAVGIGLGAFLLGVPLAIPLTVLVFLGSFIPIVGAVVTGAVAVIIALVAQGPITAVIMLAVVLAVQQLESHVLQPFIMGKAVSVHPLAVVLGVTSGAFLFGIAGALFAVPVLAVLNTSILYLRGRDLLKENRDEAERKKRDKKAKKAAKQAAKANA